MAIFIEYEQSEKTIKITTQDSYNDKDQEYEKLPAEIIRKLFMTVASEYSIYEILTRGSQKETFPLKLLLDDKKHKYIWFQKSNISQFDDILAFDKEFVITSNLIELTEKIKKSGKVRNLKEAKSNLIKESEAFISIFDSSSLVIQYNDQRILDLVLNNLQENLPQQE